MSQKQAFNFKSLLTGQPLDTDTIEVRKQGTTDLISGLTTIAGAPLTNPFAVSAAGGVGDWGFVPPNQESYDVYWVERADTIAFSQGNVDGDFFQFDVSLPDPANKEGKVFYNAVKKCLTMFNDQPGFSWDLGREFPKRVYNASTTETLLNGRGAAIVGTDPTFGLLGGYATSGDATAINTIGIYTHDVPPESYGEITVIGTVNDVPSDHLTEGDVFYLSDNLPADGTFTSARPSSPSYVVEMGGVEKSHSTDGALWCQIYNRGNVSDTFKLLNGAILESHSVAVTSDGVNVSLTLDDTASFLSLFYDGEMTKINVPATVTLTAGTDVAPALNYVYVPKSTTTLTTSMSGFPTNEQFTPVATVTCQSAASVQADGAYKVHAWTDHLSDEVGQGHLAHINKWIRQQHATWLSGVAATISGSGTGVVGVSTTAGNILQLHEHTFPAFVDPAEIYIINDPATANKKYTNLVNLTVDSEGVTLANKTFALVLWGVASEDEADCKIFGTLPSGSYSGSKPALADEDLSKYTNYTIPDGYKGTAFLFRRVIAYLNSGGTALTIFDRTGDDLRGSFPNTVAGGAGTIDALPASSVTVTPVGAIVSTDAQAAIGELDENQRLTDIKTVDGAHTLTTADLDYLSYASGNWTLPLASTIEQGATAGIIAEGVDVTVATQPNELMWGAGATISKGKMATATSDERFHDLTPNGTDAALTSGDTVVGVKYKIAAQSLLDFTAIGAADNNVGTEFTATGVLTLTAADSLYQKYQWLIIGALS